MRHAAVVGTWILALLAACGQPPVEGGMGLPAKVDGETYPGPRGELRGTLVVAQNGCVELEVDGRRWFVIWPSGARLDAVVRLPDGTVLGEGDAVWAVGGPTPTVQLVGDGAGYWGHTIGFCAPDATEVLVLDDAGPAP